MINVSNRRKKYLVRPDLPETWNNIEYRVEEVHGEDPVYVGRCIKFKDFEVDMTDWIEAILQRRGDEGIFPYKGDMYIEFDDPDVEGSMRGAYIDYSTLNSTEIIGKDDIDGVINFWERPLMGTDMYRGVYVYPVYFFKVLSSHRYPSLVGTECHIDTSFMAQDPEPGYETYNCAFYYDQQGGYDPRPSDGDYEDLMEQILSTYDSELVEENHLVDWGPKFFTENGTIDLYGNIISEPIGTFVPAGQLSTTYNKGMDIVTLKSTVLDKFEREWEDMLVDEIDGNIQLNGYGYRAVYVVYEVSPHEEGLSSYRFDSTCYFKMFDEDEGCPYMNLVLNNSDFTSGRRSLFRIPLQVQNGILRGKTISNLDKITWMDRYSDTYNGSATNKIELECYVEEDFIKTVTGNDRMYQELIGIMQTSRSSFLTGTASISGMYMEDELTCMKCRVKDVTKVTTSSKYNGTDRIPTLKITIEIYR